MLRWVFKYGAVVFLLNTILLAIEATYFIGNQVFVFLMVLYSIALVINPIHFKYAVFHKAFSFLLVINVLNFCYFILFHSITDIEAIKYLLARGVQFSIISVSIFFHFDYYKTTFLKHIVYVIILIIVLSLILNPSIFLVRYSGIIWNPNMLSSLVTIGFAIVFLKEGRYSRSDMLFLFLFLLISIATGSRGSLVALILVFLFKYGFSVRNIVFGMISFTFFVFIIYNFQLDTSINRFWNQSMFNDRILQYEYAFLSIYNKLYTGYGLDKYSYIDLSLVPIYLKGKVIGAHNGYLAILTQYGVFFGGLVLYIILQKIYSLFRYFRTFSDNERVYFFIIIYTLAASIYESLMTGINEFHTILFWFSVAMLSYSKYNKENAD